jgi:glycoside/pentoside/hexuronide:cation symporter, GPH family
MQRMDHDPSPPAPARLSRTTLAAYAAPALPLAVLTLPLYVILPTYYAANLGVSLTAVGQALLLVRLFDALNDPLIGILADRTRPRFGRRRTWFLSAIPIIVLAVWMLFVPPEGVGATWLLAFGALLSVGSTAVLVPYWAWGAELATDYGGRSRVAGAREAVVVVGTLFATATPAIAEAMGAADAGTALLILAIGVAVLLPASAIAAVFLVPEPVEYSRQRQGVLAGLAQMRRNRPFLRLLAAYVLNGFANGLPATLFLFFVGQRLQAPELAGAILFAYFLSGVAGVPLWLAVSHRLGKHRTWSIAMIGASTVFAFVPTLGPGDAHLFLAVSILTGLALGADLVLPASIQADVIDVDTAASGEQRTGTYVAAWGLGTKLALALAVGVAFPVLEWAGFDANGGPQTPFALTTLAILYAAVPVVMKLGAIALMWNFPVGASEQASLRARIEAAR